MASLVAPPVTTMWRPARDDVATGEVLGRRCPPDGGDDGLLGGDLRFALLDLWIDELDAPRFDTVDGVEHARVVVHRLVHRRGDDDRHVRAEGRGRRRGDRRVVDRAGDLADRVGGGWCDQQHVGPALAATEIDVFDPAGDLGDNVAVGRKFECPRVDDPARAVAHQRADVRALSAEFVGEFDGFHRGDAAGDAQGDVDAVKHTQNVAPVDR